MSSKATWTTLSDFYLIHHYTENEMSGLTFLPNKQQMFVNSFSVLTDLAIEIVTALSCDSHKEITQFSQLLS